MLRVGVIGCGRIAKHYLKLHSNQRTTFLKYVGYYDTVIEKSSSLANTYGGQVYQTLNSMLSSPEIDCVFILTPSGKHFLPAKLAILKGKSVLIEKPICLLPENVDELESLAINKNVALYTVLQNRFNPAVIEFTKILESFNNLFS